MTHIQYMLTSLTTDKSQMSTYQCKIYHWIITQREYLHSLFCGYVFLINKSKSYILGLTFELNRGRIYKNTKRRNE